MLQSIKVIKLKTFSDMGSHLRNRITNIGRPTEYSLTNMQRNIIQLPPLPVVL